MRPDGTPTLLLRFRMNVTAALNLNCALTDWAAGHRELGRVGVASLQVVVSSGGCWITSPSGHQLFLWPQQTWRWCLFFLHSRPHYAALAAAAEAQESRRVGPKLITMSIDFPFPIPPPPLCRGALSQRRRLCSGPQRRWDFRKIEHTKKCDKLP